MEDVITLDGSNMTIVACDSEEDEDKSTQQQQELHQQQLDQQLQQLHQQEQQQLQQHLPQQERASEIVLYKNGEVLALVTPQQGFPVQARVANR